MAGRGRPSQSGRKRYKGGKRVPFQAPDHGTDQVQALRARFAKFQDGKASQQVFDPIGRAWAVGLLENDRVDPAVLRDAGRNYAGRYWGYYPAQQAKIANYVQECRRGKGWGDGEDPMGERFQKLDKALKDAGRIAYNAAQSLCIDKHWFPDENPDWLDRLINVELVKVREKVCGGLSRDEDRRTMAAALEGLLALADGEVRRKAA